MVACAQPGPNQRPGGPGFTSQAQLLTGAGRVAGPVTQAEQLSRPDDSRIIELQGGTFTRDRGREVKVGLLLPLSGRGADVGQAMFRAAQLAMFKLGDENFVLIPRDTGGTPEGAQAAMAALLAENVELVLGPVFSGSVAAIKPQAVDAGVNVIAFTTDWRQASPAGQGTLGTPGGSGTFVMGILPYSQVDRVIGYAASQGLSRLGILAPESLYADLVVQTAQRRALEYGIDITKLTRYPDDVEDLRPVVEDFTDYQARQRALTRVRSDLSARTDTASRIALNRLKNAETYGEPPYDAALIVDGGARMSIIGPLLPFYDLDPRVVQLLGTSLWDDRSLLREPTMEGAWFASPSPERRESFTQEYRDAFGSAPPRLATLSFDAVALAAVLARQNVDFFTNDKEVRQAAWTSLIYRHDVLTSPNGFAGVDGIFRFQPNGLVERGLAVIEIGADDFTIIDPARDTFEDIQF
ncbi:MAG: penicillin-binding protein activator [Pseudomonadota bacterium]